MSWDAFEDQAAAGADGRLSQGEGEADARTRRRRSSSYRAGETIAGKYELIRPLSQGGMGSVWVARNLDLDAHVAIKLIRPDLDATFVSERFVAEARLAARIEHPAIVSVFDLGHTERNDPYIVMELLRGEDLRTILEQQGRLPATQAVQILLPIAEALATAHAKGVVHRDLKPENVFIARLDDRLQPKVVDFGIAKADYATHRRITRAGAVVGSPDYMSPEQARGLEDVDQRADIWAFCILLYECVTGSPPFADSSYEALLRDIVEKPVKPIMELGVADRELWAILERGLSKEREQRYQTMKELGRCLAHWLRSRWVDEDVCGHSLRATWLRETELGRGSSSGIQPVNMGELRPEIIEDIGSFDYSPTVSLGDSLRRAHLSAHPPAHLPAQHRVPATLRMRSVQYALGAVAIACAGWLGKPFLVPQVGATALERLPAFHTASLLAAAAPTPDTLDADEVTPVLELSEIEPAAAPRRAVRAAAPPKVQATDAKPASRPAPFREVLVEPVKVQTRGYAEASRAPRPRTTDSSATRTPARATGSSKSVARIDPVFGF